LVFWRARWVVLGQPITGGHLRLGVVVFGTALINTAVYIDTVIGHETSRLHSLWLRRHLAVRDVLLAPIASGTAIVPGFQSAPECLLTAKQ
jgi:hypothetical protein